MENPGFTEEQLRWLEDIICNKVLPAPMIMKNRWGIGQCGGCLDGILGMLETVRGFRNDNQSKTV